MVTNIGLCGVGMGEGPDSVPSVEGSADALSWGSKTMFSRGEGANFKGEKGSTLNRSERAQVGAAHPGRELGIVNQTNLQRGRTGQQHQHNLKRYRP